MCDTAGISTSFRAWCVNQGVLNAANFALIATDDASVVKECIAVAEAADPPVVFANAMEKIAVKKLFEACTAASLSTQPADTTPVNPNEVEVPPATVADLRAV